MESKLNISQPAFTANIVTKELRLDAKKLKAVQQKFSKLTEHYKGDTLTLESNPIHYDNSQVFHCVDLRMGNGTNVAWFSTVKDFKKWFNQESVDNVAQFLTRVFKLGKFEEVEGGRVFSISSNLDRVKTRRNIFELNASSSKDPYYSRMADTSARREKALEAELEKANSHYDSIKAKIKESSLTPHDDFEWEF